jgi:protein TonB
VVDVATVRFTPLHEKLSPMLRIRHLLSAATLLTVAVFILPLVALAAGGRTEMHSYFQSTMQNKAYQDKTFARVAKNWRQPPAKQLPAPGKKTVVQTVIAKDGKLVSATVSLESGSSAWDAAVLAAIKKSAPFEPLPPDYTYSTVEVHFHVAWVANP